jgi:formylglycine-generating enzyme required for sulfatase activity
VEISRPFYLGIHEVTQKQYREVMGSNPSWFSADGGGKEKVEGMSTDDFPVEQVSWQDAVDFCAKLTALPAEKGAGRAYRLPSEAEWEYSCREGASSRPFHFGNALSSRQANFDGRYPYGADKAFYLKGTCKVGSYAANDFGLYDMHGNVAEWCSDWYAADYAGKSPRRDPQGPSEGADRVIRGGGWNSAGRFCRSASRDTFRPTFRYGNLGFRVAMVPSGD